MKKLILAGAIAALSIAPAFAQSAATTDMSATGAIGSGTDYTIISRAAEASKNANTKTDPVSVQNTIAANPGLAEKLQAQGVPLDSIQSISVGANRQVTIYIKS